VKKLIFTLLILFTLNFTAFAKDKEEAKPLSFKGRAITESIKKYTISIFSIDRSGVGLCSGTLIAENEKNSFVLTCKHCLTTIEGYYAESNKVSHIITTVSDDLAILIVKGKIPGKEVVSMGKYNPFIGEDIYIVGYPKLKKSYIREGKVLRYTEDWGYADFGIVPGCSGAGAFDNREQLVGVFWGTFPDSGVSVFEPIEDVLRFLEEVNSL